jgi:cytochrome P450
MLSATDVQFDLFKPEALRNPHPILAQMRTEAPIYRINRREMGHIPWLLTRYDDCIKLLRDERFTKNMFRRPGAGEIDPNNMAMQAAATINRHMLTVDPPDHTRLRNLVHRAFTPRMIRELSGRIQQIADQLIDNMQDKTEIDLIRDYTVPLPITVIAELLGVPSKDHNQFRDWTQTLIVDATRGIGGERIGIAALEFMMYFHQLFDERRAEPKEDLITGLVQVEEAGDKLSSEELISMVFLLLGAGHETTVNLLANGTLDLLLRPEIKEKLRDNPDLMEGAVEEMLRFNGPVGASTMRWALEDVKMYGQAVHAGEMVLASLLGADRDPAVFQNPDEFDISRNPNPHMAFGNGIHYCLGAPLARMEGIIAINTMLKRLPNLALAVDPEALEWNDTILLHSMKAMPVTI